MYSLTEAAKTFTEIAALDPGMRESRLESLDDPDLVRLLRALLDADTRARREGFLDPKSR